MIEKKTLKTLYLKTKPVKFLWRKIYYLHKLYLLKINPKIIANSAYKSAFGKNINWKNPKDLIEKIYYLQLYTDTRLWTYCADKYLVREYLKEKGCEQYLTPIYGVWSDPTQIKWSSLPDRFVLKSNHACGQVIMIEDKNSIDFKKTQKKISGWLTTKYGVLNAQLHYTKIKPLILAEKNLKSKDKAEEFLIDYKIWCFRGEPEVIFVVYERNKNGYLFSAFDLNWNNISTTVIDIKSPFYGGKDLPRPKSLDEMLVLASKLSVDFKQVRVDLYEIENKPVFGELTFTTGFGYLRKDYYDYLGSKIDLT